MPLLLGCTPPILCTFNKYFLISTSVELKHFFPPEMHRGCRICLICNSNIFIPLYSTLHNDFSYIEDVHLLFCALLINIFTVLRVLNLDIFPSEIRRGVRFV